MKIISEILLEDYKKNFPQGVEEKFSTLCDAEVSTESFSFYTSVASVFSSKIEGEEIELDSYIKHKKFGMEFLPDYTKKIDDLYDAYSFAKSNALNKNTIAEAHKLLSKNIVAKSQQGKHRYQNMFITNDEGQIEYVAALPHQVDDEMIQFYEDIEALVKQKLNFQEVFYFASMIHLVFVKIHPWNDGNGRSGRLLEKWFLSEKLGPKAWFVQSEKNYYQNHQLYYDNLRRLGFEYETLDYSKAMPFLEMFPKSLFV
ncbi:Fic family protein [Flavobacterium franklandianum]|uniref:Fic family protein n=1 Tax=Flavobacterium franklandianum TaxID=2594430 RepID=A0A553CJG6_9FLAO|nr:Fic family protein [Flavobacterium franklandianum]TRX20610.1 Fic family protein [Flavobacterium franklandianum]TRX29395.1 Fic family protein [Flavobacterium franklandianum]